MKNEEFLNKVLHGDCLEWMPKIEDKSIDMILCDLPYGTTACKWDTMIPFQPLWDHYERIIKDNGSIVLTASQPFTSALVMSNPNLFKHEWIWNKNKASNFLQAKSAPLKIHESILVFGKGSITYNPQPTELTEQGKKRNNRKQEGNKAINDGVFGDRTNLEVPNYKGKTFGYPKSILDYKKEANNQHKKQVFHPTQKPVALFEYLIKTYSKEGETVLDNCLGSGTTAIASINTDRNFIGIEKEWDYCEIANERIKKAKELKVN
jgi:site-specific DNA-methyltransferase (adenine-specific)